MSLFKLPPETLVQIFDEVGSSSKRICAVSQSAKTGWQTPSRVRDSIASLGLELMDPQVVILGRDSRPTAIISNSASPYRLAEGWIEALNHDLDQLAMKVREAPRLRTLHVRASHYSFSGIRGVTPDYLRRSTMRALLSVENLSDLVLDLTVPFLSAPQSKEKGKEKEECSHICPAISALLPSLRSLHVRMRNICPEVLKFRETDRDLRLRVVVINLGLTSHIPEITSVGCSKRCGSETGPLKELLTDIRKQAEALITRMASPQAVRILTYPVPQWHPESLDVLNGKRMRLEDEMAWDDDGKTISEVDDEEEEESEIEISDEDFVDPTDQ
ncbi:hypothetical protein F4777DRAFT_600012 [Nemania sp. FL0916]|nr:hypothetical protein F4777DRAFT_600012 [Nemania sp. FL0916]